jgi:hypothetical protein
VSAERPDGGGIAADAALGGRGRLTSTIFLVCSLLTSAVFGVFFLIGIADGSVSSFNLVLWLALLAAMGLSLWAGLALRAKGKFGPAVAALAFTAIPGIAAGLFILILLVAQPRWN